MDAAFINTILLLIIAAVAVSVAIVLAAFNYALRRTNRGIKRELQRLRTAESAPRNCPVCGDVLPGHHSHCLFRKTSPRGDDLAALVDIEVALRTLDRLEQESAAPIWALESVRQGLLRQREAVLRKYRAAEIPGVQPASVSPPAEVIEIESLPAVRAVVRADEPRTPPPPMPRPIAESREKQPLSSAKEPVPRAAAAPKAASPAGKRIPRMSWRDVLTSFMEEKNILWGEVVGGLLIVGGAIALVVSLWETLEDNPYFPFAVFASITAALYGGGLYSWKHWRLQATSRGLLVIATMMTPLAYLVLPSMLGVSGGLIAEVPVVLAAAALFAFCLWRTAAIVTLPPHWALPSGVIVPALTAWVAAGIETPAVGSLAVAGLLAIPTVTFVAATGWVIRRWDREPEVTVADAARLIAVVGLCGFALGVAVVFSLSNSNWDTRLAVHLAPLVSLASVPIVWCGAKVSQRMQQAEGDALMQTAGSALMGIGTGLMLVAYVFARTHPVAAFAIAAVQCFTLAYFAFRQGEYGFHIPSLLFGLLSFLSAQTAWDSTRFLDLPLWELWWDRWTGVRITVFALVVGIVGEGLARLGRSTDSRFYALFAGSAALGGVALSTSFAQTAPALAGISYALAGGGLLLGNLRYRNVPVGYLGAGLLVAATGWLMQYFSPGNYAQWSLALACCATLLAGVGSLVASGWKSGSQVGRSVAMPCINVATVTGVLAAGIGAITGMGVAGWQGSHVVAAALLTVLYLLVTATMRWILTATLAGLMLLATSIMVAEWAVLRFTLPFGMHAVAFASAAAAAVTGAMTLFLHTRLVAITGNSLSSNESRERGIRLPRLFSWKSGLEQDKDISWIYLLPLAWREVAITGAVLSLWFLFHAGSLGEMRLPTFTLGLVAVALACVSIPLRTGLTTWAACIVGAGAFQHGLAWELSLSPQYLGPFSLLAVSSLLVLIGILLRRFESANDPDSSLHRHLLVPGWHACVSATFLTPITAVPIHLIGMATTDAWLLAAAGAWLGGLWLIFALRRRSLLFWRSSQLALCGASFYVMTAWMAGRPWAPVDVWWTPLVFECYGVGASLVLAAFVLAARAAVKWESWRGLALGGWERQLMILCVALAMGLVEWGTLREVIAELVPSDLLTRLDLWPQAYKEAYGGGAWALWAVLAVLAVVALWHPRGPLASLTCLVILLAVLPALVAGRFAIDRAAGSALRWGAALVFLLGSLPLWFTTATAHLGKRLGIAEVGGGVVDRLRLLHIDLNVPPVVVITGVAVAAAGAVSELPGPIGGIFAAWPPLVSYLVPALLVGFTFAGFAWSQRSDGFALTAGVVFLLGGFSSHLLAVLLAAGRIGTSDFLPMLQVATIVAAAWAVIWHFGLRNVDYRSGRVVSPLRNLFLLVPVLLLTAILAFAVFDLSGKANWWVPGEVAAEYPGASQWQRWTCTPLGWLALGLGLYATALGSSESNRWSRWVILAPIAVAAMLAVQIQVVWPGWGFRGLLVLLCSYLTAAALFASGLIHTRATGHPTDLHASAGGGVILGGLLLLLVGTHGYFAHHDYAWALGAMAVGSVVWMAVGARRRDASLYSAGSFVAAVALGLFVWEMAASLPLDRWWGHLFYSVAIVTLGATALWFALVDRHGVELRPPRTPVTLVAQSLLGAISAVLPVIVFIVRLASHPNDLGTTFGVEIGWPALGLLIGLAVWTARRTEPRWLAYLVGVGALLLSAQCAATVHAAGYGACASLLVLDYGTALAAVGVASIGLIRAGRLPRLATLFRAHALHSRDIQITWELLNLVTVGFAVRTVVFPEAPVVAMIGIFALLVLSAVVMHQWTGHAWYTIHVASLAVIGAIATWWTGPGPAEVSLLIAVALALAVAAAICRLTEQAHTALGWVCHPRFPYPVLLMLLLFLLAVARSGLEAWGPGIARELFSAAGLVIALSTAAVLGGLHALREVPATSSQDSMEWTPTSLLAYWSAFFGLSLDVLKSIGPVFQGATSEAPGELVWWTTGAIVLAACTFAYGRQLTRAPLFCAGLLAIAVALTAGTVTWLELARFGGIAVAAYQAAFLGLSIWIAGIGLPIRRDLRVEQESWFVAGQWVAGALVMTAALVTSLSGSTWPERCFGPISVLLALPVFVRLGAVRRGSIHRYLAVTAGVALLLVLGWSVVDPISEYRFLAIHVMSVVAVGAGAVLCGPVLQRYLRDSEKWASVLQRSFTVLWTVDVFLVPTVLTHEIMHIGEVMLPAWSQIVFAVTVAALASSSVWFALRPSTTAASESTKMRHAYVYAAEVLLLLLVVHLKITGVIGRQLDEYRPFIIIALAFAGVGVGELFRRRGLEVLAEPLQRTGVFLPVLPLIMFWWEGDTSFLNWQRLDFIRYASLWFLAGGVYVLMSAVRRSHAFALVAAAAFNAGLWSILFHHRGEVGIWRHPQLWLIPPALILLVAEHLNRERLSKGTATALRYAGILMLYLSSAADLFLAGVDNIALSLVLAVLSIAGILAGIALRVLGFMVTGIVFLAMVVGMRIWHAAVAQQQHWVWGLTAIGLGLGVLLLFALLERRRDVLRQAVEEMRRWRA